MHPRRIRAEYRVCCRSVTRLCKIALATLSAGTACSTDAGSSDPDAGSGLGVPGELQVAELTDEQAREICARVGESFAEALNEVPIATLCVAATVLLVDTETDCENLSPQCEQAAAMSEDMEFASMAECRLAQSELRAGCPVTVGQIEACLADTRRGVQPAADAVDCSLAGQEEALRAVQNNPATCADFQQRCPSVAPDTLLLLLP